MHSSQNALIMSTVSPDTIKQINSGATDRRLQQQIEWSSSTPPFDSRLTDDVSLWPWCLTLKLVRNVAGVVEYPGANVGDTVTNFLCVFVTLIDYGQSDIESWVRVRQAWLFNGRSGISHSGPWVRSFCWSRDELFSSSSLFDSRLPYFTP